MNLRNRASLVIVLCVVALWCRVSAGQAPSLFGTIVEGTLTIGLSVQAPTVLNRIDIARLPHTSVKVKDAGGKVVVYRGVLVRDVLDAAGLRRDRKQDLGSYVMIEGVDDPHVLFALAEFDTTLSERRVIVADAKNGKPMVPPEGPFRIIVSDERQPTRWVPQVWAIYVIPES